MKPDVATIVGPEMRDTIKYASLPKFK